MTTLLIDGDMLVHRACASVEVEERFGEWQHVLTSNYNEALDKAEQLIDDIVVALDVYDYILVFSDKDNWRKSVMPTYKENRKGVRKPLCMKRLVDHYLREECENVIVKNLEADDVMGIMAFGNDAIIVSGDKDFRSVPGKFVRLDTDWHCGPLEDQTIPQARFNHLVQALAGDPVDGYKGCPGYGPVKATSLINEVVDMEGEVQEDELQEVWFNILNAYYAKGITQDEALLNAQVAYILHRPEDDCSTRWSPLITYAEVL